MSLRMFDFQCPNGHVFEGLVAPSLRIHPCPKCGKQGDRLIATPRVRLDGISGDFPTASDAWEKRRESHMRKEQRNQERHGTYD